MKQNYKQIMAGKVLRTDFPYGMILDMDGSVVFFNRDYDALAFGGKKEFHFDPMALGIDYESIQDGMFLMTEDGKVYVGKMYYLYEDCTSPQYMELPKLTNYLIRLHAVLQMVIGIIENAHRSRTATKAQFKEVEKKMKTLSRPEGAPSPSMGRGDTRGGENRI